MTRAAEPVSRAPKGGSKRITLHAKPKAKPAARTATRKPTTAATQKSKTTQKPVAKKQSTKNPFWRAAAAVGRVVAKFSGRGKQAKAATRSESDNAIPAVAKAPRTTKRQSDIAMDHLAESYSPQQTGLRIPFRSSGTDSERDQEFAGGVDDSRWKDEDRLTNKSGDPRIGTHNRTYEPAPKRAEGSDNDYDND
ncbi:MAG: hypothetical protein ABI837_20175 [Acidobacteriota bacterium]